jgi:hypothetical protein
MRGRGSRRLHPNRSAATRRHSRSERLENGRPSASTFVSLMSRSCTGSIPVAYASSSIADSSANEPHASPGARMNVGVAAFSFRKRCVTSRFGVP